MQLQTLTAVVKLFLKKPDESQAIVQRVLNTATKDCDSPDVRDRAYIYWRLLSTDPGAAKVSSQFSAAIHRAGAHQAFAFVSVALPISLYLILCFARTLIPDSELLGSPYPSLCTSFVIQAVVLAQRPPILIPQTTVAPALLEELLGEISSLASVYHKPEETFVGRGRVGADSVQKRGDECVFVSR